MPFLTMDSKPKGEDLLRHIDHVANVVGEDHVGIGTDNGVLPQAVDEAAKKRIREWNAERVKAGMTSMGKFDATLTVANRRNSNLARINRSNPGVLR